MTAEADRAVLVGLLREEWRLHSRLFGGARFGAFPVLMAALAGGAIWLLESAGPTLGSIVAGLHALVFVFGLHTGSIGFVGRDAIRNVLGDVTLLVFVSRTLPVSPRRLLGLFLVKELVYYSGLFLLPLTVAVVPTAGPAFLPRAPLLWLTLVATFLLGVSTTLLAIALSSRGRPGRAAAVAAGLVLAAAWLAGIDPVDFTPYALYAQPSVTTALATAGPIAALAGLGLGLYDPAYRRPARTARRRFDRWRRRLGDRDGLLTKTLLDVARSSGGLWKVVFSGAVLFAVVAFLVRLVETVTGVEPSTGVSFGALLGLTAFTTYNWLTQFDAPEDYLVLPVGVADVFAAKFRAFLVLGLPVGIGFLGLAVAALGARPVEVVVGLVLVVGIELYLLGLTVYLAGFDPNEFLFDTVLFAAFGGAVALVLVPVLIVGFVLAPLGAGLAAATGAVGLVAGGLGLGLFRRAVPKWEAAIAGG